MLRVLLVLVGVVILIAAVNSLTGPAQPVPTATAQPPATKPKAMNIVGGACAMYVEPAVKSHLKDPDSAKFGTIHCLDNRRMMNGKVVRNGGMQVTFACGTVNSRNGFGGYTGFQHFVEIIEPVQGMFIESQGGVFVDIWNKLCAHNSVQ
jgi:hypothetical protein